LGALHIPFSRPYSIVSALVLTLPPCLNAPDASYGHLYETSAASLLQVATPYMMLAALAALGVDTARLVPPQARAATPRGFYATFEKDIGFAGALNPASCMPHVNMHVCRTLCGLMGG
jgi:hypothetical protein